MSVSSVIPPKCSSPHSALPTELLLLLLYEEDIVRANSLA